MGAPLLLLLDRLARENLALAALALEARVAAAPQGQLAALEVKDLIGDVVEQIAVMADDDDRRGAALQIVGEPQHAFEVEIVGRFVEKQEVGLGEQHRGERHPHTPAAGIFCERPALRRLVEAEPLEDSRRPRRRGMSADIEEAGVNFGDAAGIGRDFRFGEERRALAVGREDEVDQAFRSARRLLLDAADAQAFRCDDFAALGRELAADQAEKCGLAGAVASDEPDMRS